MVAAHQEPSTLWMPLLKKAWSWGGFNASKSCVVSALSLQVIHRSTHHLPSPIRLPSLLRSREPWVASAVN